MLVMIEDRLRLYLANFVITLEPLALTLLDTTVNTEKVTLE